MPHDWSIESEINEGAPSTGRDSFFATRIGRYRKTAFVPNEWAGRKVAIEFEGIYRNAEVWFNGVSLGKHPYGYTMATYELKPYVCWGRQNELEGACR